MVIKRPIEHPDPEVSVVIPTIPKNSYELVETLEDQTTNKYEVIIVSDNSLDICEARNLGMKKAKGEIIANTDDDCRPPVSWVENIRDTFQLNPEVVILGGSLDKHSSSPHGYIGANISYRRSEAIKIGGFDSEFAGWRDDTDFGLRMEIEYGQDRCIYDPDLEVIHIGPLRTNIDRKLEKKFRSRHTKYYFMELYSQEIPFGTISGKSVAKLYSVFPSSIELLLLFRRHITSKI